jgi:hypothetical protein
MRGAIPQRNRLLRFTAGCARAIAEAGTGGKMSESSKKLAAQSKPSVINRGKKATGKKTTGRGASLLSEAADKTLEENSCEIAKSLLDSTLKGNVNSARLLLALAEGPAENEKTGTKRRRRSEAKKLAAEPEWRGEPVENAAETGIG